MRHRLLSALVIALAFVLAACGESAPVFRNTDLTGAAFGRSLAGLKDHHGKAVSLDQFKGRALVVFFGYTACPDVCPTTLAKLAGVLQALGKDASRVQVALITLDPERDTAERLAAYVTAFNPSFVGLYGDAAATEAAARDFKVFFAKASASGGAHAGHGGVHHQEDKGGAGNYMIDHTAGAYLFDPHGRVRLYVKDDAPIEAIAADIKILLAGK